MIRRTFGGLIALTALIAASPSAWAQSPRPILPTEEMRSGLLSRWTVPQTGLPVDPDRDIFYGARWGDQLPTHPNLYCTSGLYGQRLRSNCVATYPPYFWGSASGSTAGQCCEPVHNRLIGNFVHPWRPVGGYYAGGAAVPIYDLDPIAPGPGRFPYPWLYKRQHQGG